MAKKKKPKLSGKARPKLFTPGDYLRGSKIAGNQYTAWDTYGQGRPDFGKGAGPGEPYREVKKTNSGIGAITRPKSPILNPPKQGRIPTISSPSRPGVTNDPKVLAIRRRLGWQ